MRKGHHYTDPEKYVGLKTVQTFWKPATKIIRHPWLRKLEGKNRRLPSNICKRNTDKLSKKDSSHLVASIKAAIIARNTVKTGNL